MAAAVNVRMYNQLSPGNCFLLHFANGRDESFVLVDFGSYEKDNVARELEIANDIYKTVGDKPLIVVLTQQHRDHLSGFISGGATLKNLNIVECWYCHKDNNRRKDSENVQGITKTLWKKNITMKENVRTKFGGVNAVDKMLEAQDAIDLLSDDEITNVAIKNLASWSKNHPRHLSPGESFDLPGVETEVRVYVLGSKNAPSLTPKMKNLESASSLMFDALNVDADGMNQPESPDFPFNKKYIRPIPGKSEVPFVIELYYNSDVWRRIDHVWLNEMGRMSLHMDQLNMNRGLVLAFDLVEQQKVLLFDTKENISDWESWTDFVAGNNNGDAFETKAPLKVAELLSRVVLYKPGRYAVEHSKTNKSAGLLNGEELAIMLPVNEEASKKTNFGMVSLEMLKEYNQMSRGRILRSDTIYQTEKNEHLFEFPFASTEYDFPSAVKIAYDRANENHLYVEYTIR